MSDKPKSRTIKSVTTALNIVQVIREKNGATVTEIATHLDLSPATVHSHLSTLKQEGYVVQRETAYDLGPQFLAAGGHVRNKSRLYQASKEEVDKLAEETGECVHLIIEHGGQLFALYERFGPDAIGTDYHDQKRGKPLNHLHCTAAGKSILAQLPEQQVERIIDERGLPENTNKTIHEREMLLEELAEVRERGYAFADEEQLRGIRAVGAPIFGPNNDAAGAIAVSGPTSRLQRERFYELLPETIQQTTNICEVNFRTLALS